MAPDSRANLAERVRRARELNDTLIQRFMGLVLQMDGVQDALRRQSNPLADDLARILGQAELILREARETIGAEGQH